MTHLFDLYRSCRVRSADPGRRRRDPPRADDLRLVLDPRLLASRRSPARWPATPGWPARSSASTTSTVFHDRHRSRIGPVAAYGFFGGEHERNDREWDANGAGAVGVRPVRPDPGAGGGIRGQGLLALRLRRRPLDPRQPQPVRPVATAAGAPSTSATRTSRTTGTTCGGWPGCTRPRGWPSASARNETAELWAAFDILQAATADSIRWVLGQQRAGAVGDVRADRAGSTSGGWTPPWSAPLATSTRCRLYTGAKLGDDIDLALPADPGDDLVAFRRAAGSGTTRRGTPTART